MSLKTTTSPVTSPAKRELPSPTKNASNEFSELKDMIAKASEVSSEHFIDAPNTPMSSSKRTKLTNVESARLPNPLSLPTPEFKIPLPVFSGDFSRTPVPGSLFTLTPTSPPTPRRKTPQAQESPFERQYQQACNGSFTFQNRTYQIREFGRGSFSTIYTLTGNEPQLFAKTDNSQLVIKVYNGIRMKGFNHRAMIGYLSSAIENYTQVTSLNLAVATIHNSTTALSDLAIIQEKVDADIDLNSSEQMAQVKRFFSLSVQTGVLMDLQPANLKVKNGTVVLIDFVEELDDHNISTMINLALKAWVQLFKDSGLTRGQAETHLHQLTEDFEKANPYFSTKWLQDLLNG